MNSQNLVRLENRELILAVSIGICCEFGEAKNNGSCDEEDVKEYIRRENDCDGSSWDKEPIFLCEKHSAGHQIYLGK